MRIEGCAAALSEEARVRGEIDDLGDGDLIEIVLGGGQRRARAALLARRLGRLFPSLSEVAAASHGELASIDGMGAARARALQAAIALGRRADHREIAPGDPIAASEHVFHHFHPRLAGLRQERFYVVLLDGKGRMMRDLRVSEGTLTASLVHPREVFRRAIREAAASMILVHNHPSGDPEPSPEDVTLTARLRAAGDLLGIRVLDHVVIGRNRYVSFADQGRM